MNPKRYIKEGSGAGVLIQVPDFNGKLVKAEKSKEDNEICILHFEDCSMRKCTLSTYDQSAPEWMDGDFVHGKVSLKVFFDEYVDETFDQLIDAIDIGQIFVDGDFTIVHGGGYSHVSLEEECEGKVVDGEVYNWRNHHTHYIHVYDKQGYTIVCGIEDIVFDFDKQIEDYYEELSEYWLQEDEDNLNETYKKKYLRKIKTLEGFRPSDKLSPSETVAVCSMWTRDNFVDSWKSEGISGDVSFSGEIKDTFAPIEVYIFKEEKLIQICYLKLDENDIKDLIQDLDSEDDEDLRIALRDAFDDEVVMACKTIEMPTTRIELERELDRCKEIALDSYNDLEKEFYERY